MGTTAAGDAGSNVLADQIALVTGGGSGIGLGCARALIRDGATVMLSGRTAERLDTAATTLRQEFGPDAGIHTMVCDVTDEAQVAALLSTTAERAKFTMLVANAGFGGAAPLHLTSLEEWNAIIATNLTGAFLCIKHAAPHLAEAARSSDRTSAIVGISSIAGTSTHRFMTPYNVSKAGLDMLIRQTADELGASGIRANSVRPGLVPTDASQMLMAVPEIHDDYLAQMPLGRTGTTEEVAELVRFLLGPESSWITGTTISVDGGHHLRRGPDLTPALRAVLGDAINP